MQFVPFCVLVPEHFSNFLLHIIRATFNSEVVGLIFYQSFADAETRITCCFS